MRAHLAFQNYDNNSQKQNEESRSGVLAASASGALKNQDQDGVPSPSYDHGQISSLYLFFLWQKPLKYCNQLTLNVNFLHH